MKRLLPLLLLLLLAACQTAPPPAGSEAPSGPPEASGGADSAAGPDSPAGLPDPGSGEGSRPLELAETETVVKVPETPDTACFLLARWDGEQGREVLGCRPEERAALAGALPEVRGWAVLEDRGVPKDPWPIYTLEIGGVEKDFTASYGGGIWRDNQGNVLRAEVDFDGLWHRFGEASKAAEEDGGTVSAGRPASRELALAGGGWDARFLREAAVQEPDPLVPMTLAFSGGGLDWTVTNQSGHAVIAGNRVSAKPQVKIADKWYDVPVLSGTNYAWTMEGIAIPDGKSFDGTFWQEPFGRLPDGTYRLVLSYTWQEPQAERRQGAAAPFSVRNGNFEPVS